MRLEKHNEYFIFPVIVLAYHKPTREVSFELGLIKWTITLTLKIK